MSPMMMCPTVPPNMWANTIPKGAVDFRSSDAEPVPNMIFVETM